MGTKLSWQLQFIWRHLIFVGHHYGTCWDLKFWSGFEISGNCVHPRLSKFTVYKFYKIQYFCTSVLSYRSYNNFLPFYITVFLHDLHFNYLLVPRETTIIPFYNFKTYTQSSLEDPWQLMFMFWYDTSKLSFHCTCTQNMCGNHLEQQSCPQSVDKQGSFQ
jgi:hypothetical protein